MRVLAVLLLIALGYAQEPGEKKKKERTPAQIALQHMGEGRTAIAAEKIPEAIDHLQKAIAQLQKLVTKGLARWLPKAPKEWTRGKIKLNSGSWAGGEQAMQWNEARSRYTTTDGRVMNASVTTSPQSIKANRQAGGAYMNPQVLKMMNNDRTRIESINADGWIGWIVVQRGRNATLVAMAKNVMFSLSLKTGDNMDTIKQFWAAFDRKGCAAAHP